MGSPRTLFGNLAFTFLLPSFSTEAIENYFIQLSDTLREFYPLVRISSKAALECFSPIPSGDSWIRSREYSFTVGSDNESERWGAILYRAQIPHLELGSPVDAQTTGLIDPKLLYRLAEKKLASVVVHKNTTTQQSILSQLFRPNEGTEIVATVVGLYLIWKIDSIPSLSRKLHWEIFRENSFRFSEFLAELSSTLSAANIEPVVTIPFDRKSPRQFVQKCDSELRSMLSTSQLEQTLRLINVSIDDWFGAKI